ncbi:hypothetical protein Mx4_p65 [Myxococcus phage Mx4]|nr:hypothetical protein Mx4_p65 [Myxococcus phage Mx4]
MGGGVACPTTATTSATTSLRGCRTPTARPGAKRWETSRTAPRRFSASAWRPGCPCALG